MTLFAFLLTINFQKRHLNKECDWSLWPIRNVNFFFQGLRYYFLTGEVSGGVKALKTCILFINVR